MTREENIKKRIRKGILIFLGVLLICTVLSKTIYVLLLPQVTTEKCTSGAVKTKILAQGLIGMDKLTIDSQKVDAVSALDGQVIVCSKEAGQKVKKGEVLCEVQGMVDKSAQAQDKMTRDEISINISSCERQIKENEAKKETTLKKLEEKQEKLQKGEKSYELASIESQIKDTEDTLKLDEELLESGLVSKEEYEGLQEKLLLLKKQKDEQYQKDREDEKNEVETLKGDLETITGQIADLQEKIKLENNKLEGQVSSKEKESILSPITGTIYEVNIAEGATVSTRDKLFTIIPEGIPITLSFPVSDEESNKIDVETEFEWVFDQDRYKASVVKKSFDEKNKQTIVTGSLTAEDIKKLDLEFKSYKNVDVTVTSMTEKYDMLVSNSAVVNESGTYYIYTIDQQDGLFETHYFVKKTLITCIKQGDEFAAIEAPIDSQTVIVKQTNKPLRDGLEVAVN